MRAQIAVVGGGPAGLATAIFAARRGLSILVVDKREPPLDKPCGEGIMPPGVADLVEMGVDIPAASRAPFAGIRYLDGELIAEGRFVKGEGLGVRRTTLVGAMAERARSLGVDLQYGVAVREWKFRGQGVLVDTTRGSIEADFLIGADGLHSPIRRQAGLEKPWRGRPRFGMRRHFRVAPWSSFVEVHWGQGLEAYVTPVRPEEVAVALLCGQPARFESLLARFPRLERELSGAPVASPVRGAGPLRQGVGRRTAGERLALVGDAAGYLDPLTGVGLSLAFRSARALVETIANGHRLSEYERRYRELSRTYYFLTGLLLAVAALPRLRRRVVAALARRPSLFQRLLEVNTGQAPPASLGWNGVARLIAGVAFPRLAAQGE